MKKILSFVIALLIIFGTFPVSIFADEIDNEEYNTDSVDSVLASAWSGEIASGYAGGNGTKESPYFIATAGQLAYLAKQVNAGNGYSGTYFELINNIDLGDIEWTPIGNSLSNPFYGNFCGNGYKISGLSFTTTTSTAPVGLFGCNYGVISDLNVSAYEIYKDYSALKSTIADMEVGDYAIGRRTAVIGAIAGANYGTIKHAEANVGILTARYITNDSSGWKELEIEIGLITGRNEGTVTKCCSGVGTLKGYNDYYILVAGGITGFSTKNSIISDCYSNVICMYFDDVRDARIGGLVGAVYSSKIERCHAYSMTEYYNGTTFFIGGLVGESNYSTIESCYATGKITALADTGLGGKTSGAGLVARSITSTIMNCYTNQSSIYVSTYEQNGTTRVGKLVAYLDVDNYEEPTEPTSVVNCHVSDSTVITRRGQVGSGCDIAYPETNEESEATKSLATGGFVASSSTIQNTLEWKMYQNISHVASNPSYVWKMNGLDPALYISDICSLTIRYLDDDGGVIDTYFGYYDRNSQYSVKSPEKYGFAPNSSTVSGTITQDTFIDVKYSHAHVPGAEATCISEQVCVLCGAVIKNMLEHTYVPQSVIEPSCTEMGYTVYACTYCGTAYNDDYLAPLGHLLNADYECSRCGLTFDEMLRNYTIYLFDIETAKPIAGASVYIDDIMVLTDSSGAAKFQIGYYDEYAHLRIVADSYPKQDIQKYYLNNFGSETYYFTSNETGIISAWCNGDNVISGDTQINCYAPALTAKIEIVGQAKADIIKYELLQDGVVFATSTNGDFRVNNAYFRPGFDVYVRMHTNGADGYNCYEKKLNIRVTGFVFNFGTDFEELLPFSLGLDLTFPNGTPGFEGFNAKIPNPWLKNSNIIYKHENDKILVLLGVDEDYAKDPKFEDMTFEEILADMYDDYTSLVKKDKKSEISGSFGLVVEFDENGITNAYGQINVGVELEYSVGKTFMVWVIPVYAEVGLSLEGDFDVSHLGYDIFNSKFYTPNGKLTLEGAIDLYGGLGCAIASLGIYGRAVAELVLNTAVSKGFEKFSISGELGIYAKVKVIFFKELCYKLALLQGQKTWPDHISNNIDSIYSIDSYETDLREYLSNRTYWNSNINNFSNGEFTTLQSSSYTAIEPRIVPYNDTMMMFFLDDDGSEGFNYQHLYYSLYNKSNGSWGTPKVVDNNELSEVEFDIYSDGSNIYVSYTELGLIDETNQDDFGSIISTAEIIFAQYDGANDCFINHKNVSSISGYDTMPRLTSVNDGVVVTWVHNQTNDLFMQNANNTIMISVYSNGIWESPYELTEKGATVVSLDIGTLDNSIYVASIRDIDCDLSSVDDRVVDLIDMSGTVTNVVLDKNTNDSIQFVDISEEKCAIWYNDSNIYKLTSINSAPCAIFASNVEGLSGNYRFVHLSGNSYAIFFTKNENIEDANGDILYGSNIYGLYNYYGVWGGAVPVTELSAGTYVDTFDACYFDGKLMIPHVSAEVTFTADDIIKNCNFCTLFIDVRNDLIVEGASYPASQLTTGDSIDLTIKVKNNASDALYGVECYLIDSDGENIIFTKNNEYIANSGEVGYIGIKIPKNVLKEGESYTIKVSPKGYRDADPTNNSAQIALWYTDFTVAADTAWVGNELRIQYSIKNRGNISGDADIKFYKLNSDQNEIILHAETVRNVGSGETIFGTINVTNDFYDIGYDKGLIYMEVVPYMEEIYNFNDTVSVVVEKLEFSPVVKIEDYDKALASPVILEPYTLYDKSTNRNVTVEINENGYEFVGVDGVGTSNYSYNSSSLTINSNYLQSLTDGYHCIGINFRCGDKTVTISSIIEISSSMYKPVEIFADNQTVKYDGLPLSLEKDIVYTTESLGTISAHYSTNGGYSWNAGLPVDVGTYQVRLSVSEDIENGYLQAECMFVLQIEKGTRAITAPKIINYEDNILHFGGAQPTAGEFDGLILYGYSTDNDIASVVNWSESGDIREVIGGTTYYIFAKIIDGRNYEDAYSTGIPFSTDYIDSGKCGDNLTWTLYEDGELVIEGMGDMWNYNNATNKAPWRKYSDKLTKLTLTEGMTSIGKYAFYQCDGFVGELVIPNSVTDINSYTFYGCTGFDDTLRISSTTTSIAAYAFYNCKFIGELILPDGLLTIGDYSFSGCDEFTGSLQIPDSVISIGNYAFRGCSGFSETLAMGDNVTTIGNMSFSECWGFTKILLNNVNVIGESAFSGCSGLTEIEIPESAETICAYAFSNCGSLAKAAVYSKTVKFENDTWDNCGVFEGTHADFTIYSYAGSTAETYAIANNHPFVSLDGRTIIDSGKCGDNLTWTLYDDGELVIEGTGEMWDYDYKLVNGSVITTAPWGEYSSQLKTLALETGMTSIGKYAFYNCSGFTGKLIIPNSVISIGVMAFEACRGFTGDLVIPDSVTSIDYGAFWGCRGFTGDLVIPDSVTTIGEYAFYYCDGFTGDLTIGNSVTTIGEYAFYHCDGFTGDLTIGNSVTTIGERAFSGCDGFIGDLTIGSSVIDIGECAFSGCDGFTGDLIIPDSVMSIGNEAFCGCNGFTGNLTIGNGVITIGYSAFYGCSGFTGELVIPDSVISIGVMAFQECRGFTGDLVIPNRLTSISVQAFCGCSGFTGNLVIPNSVTSIGDAAFENCSGFTGDLVIPDSVTSIDYGAFWGCSGFTGELVIPDSVTSIGDGAFLGCSGFTGELVIPDRVTSIGSDTFYGCYGFTGELVIPDRVTSIGRHAFYECDGFTGNLVIPDSVTSIGYGAFHECDGFTGVLVIPDSVTSIDDWAFEGCSMDKVYFKGNAPSVSAATSGSPSFNSDVTLYYLPETTGWVDSEYYDAANQTWNGYKLEVWTKGVTLTGKLTTYLSATDVVTLSLFAPDTTEAAYITTLAGDATEYKFDAVATGTYTMVVEKKNHVTREYEIVIEDADVVQDVKIHPIGDIDGNGKVNSRDWNAVRDHINKSAVITDKYKFACADLDGNGKVNSRDWNRIRDHINKTNPIW